MTLNGGCGPPAAYLSAEEMMAVHGVPHGPHGTRARRIPPARPPS
ncbi:hypothetical protein QJS66_14045 [Kocuria rhizophila]|nr:hypothetical protein QJS66_14045 [Kocuria rhizophila]